MKINMIFKDNKIFIKSTYEEICFEKVDKKLVKLEAGQDFNKLKKELANTSS